MVGGVSIREVDNLPALVALCDLDMVLGNTDRGLSALNRALLLSPAYVPALERAIPLKLARGDLATALRYARLLLQSDPESIVGNFALALNQQVREDYNLAEATYRRVLALSRMPEALNNLAWLLLEKGEIDEALNLAEECTMALPEYASGWDTLGVIYLRLGRHDDAIQAINRALEVVPDYPEAQVHFVELYVARGMKEEARELADLLMETSSALTSEQRDQVAEIVKRLR